MNCFWEKTISLLFLVVSSCPSFSQVTYKAGDTLQGFVDINPDTTLGVNCQGLFSLSEDYYFDFNNDFQPELKILAYCSNAHIDRWEFVSISILDTNLYTLFGRTDSVYHTYLGYWWAEKAAKPLNKGDTINSINAIWVNQSLYIYLSAATAGTSISISDWKIDTIDKFIGLKYYYSNDTIYGWIRLSYKSGQYIFKDYSLSSSLININDPDRDLIRVYPNPATDRLFVEFNNTAKSELALYNSMGQHVLKKILSSVNRVEILVDNLSNGIYYLKINTGRGIINRKIIIQH